MWFSNRDFNFDLPLGPAGGPFQLESSLRAFAEADIVDNLGETELGGADQRLGVFVGGDDVDDVDVQRGVFDRRQEGDVERFVPVRRRVPFGVDLRRRFVLRVDPNDGVRLQAAVAPIDILEISGGLDFHFHFVARGHRRCRCRKTQLNGGLRDENRIPNNALLQVKMLLRTFIGDT